MSRASVPQIRRTDAWEATCKTNEIARRADDELRHADEDAGKVQPAGGDRVRNGLTARGCLPGGWSRSPRRGPGSFRPESTATVPAVADAAAPGGAACRCDDRRSPWNFLWVPKEFGIGNAPRVRLSYSRPADPVRDRRDSPRPVQVPPATMTFANERIVDRKDWTGRDRTSDGESPDVTSKSTQQI